MYAGTISCLNWKSTPSCEFVRPTQGYEPIHPAEDRLNLPKGSR
jgi:hypothetical protein